MLYVTVNVSIYLATYMKCNSNYEELNSCHQYICKSAGYLSMTYFLRWWVQTAFWKKLSQFVRDISNT